MYLKYWWNLSRSALVRMTVVPEPVVIEQVRFHDDVVLNRILFRTCVSDRQHYLHTCQSLRRHFDKFEELHATALVWLVLKYEVDSFHHDAGDMIRCMSDPCTRSALIEEEQNFLHKIDWKLYTLVENAKRIDRL